MNKALCVMVLLLGGALMVKSSDGSSAGSTSPVIVAKGRFVSRSTPIPTTTMFTPQQTGLYRLSVYMTAIRNGAPSITGWSYSFSWADDAGIENTSDINLNGNGLTYLHPGNQPPSAYAYSDWTIVPGAVVPFEAIAGVPVTYAVTELTPTNGSTYSLYYTVEHLE